MAVSHSLTSNERKHWWVTNRKIVDKYIKDAKHLIATGEQNDVASALNLLDAALALSPQMEIALELKARSLIYLRRFKEVADMLKDYIPSLKDPNEDSGSGCADNSSTHLARERVKLLQQSSNDSTSDSLSTDSSFKCFSVSDLKKRVMAGLCKNHDKEGQWRYTVLGQACCNLGLMEDAMALLQTGKRLATAANRRESVSWSDDSFFLSNINTNNEITFLSAAGGGGSGGGASPPRFITEAERVSHLVAHIKILIRRRAAAFAALEAGLYPEAIRHFSKIVDSRRGAPQGFLADCYMHRAAALRSAGRIAEAIADCNKTLALDPSCIHALDTRASLLETIRCLPDCLHDLEHLKLLYNAILRDRKLPGPAWKRHNLSYREIPGKLTALTTKITELKQRVASGETGNVDFYGFIGLRRGCSRSELERAHLLLCLKHKPDKACGFIDRCELSDERDLDSVKDRAKMSSLLLYRLIQKGYSSVLTTIMDEEFAEKQRKKAAAALLAAQAEQEAEKAVQAAEKAAQTEKAAKAAEQEAEKAVQAAEQVAKAAQEAIEVEKLQKNRELDIISSSKSLEVFSGPNNRISTSEKKTKEGSMGTSSSSNVFQGVFCRDLAAVGSLLSQVGFNRPIPMKYEALSC